jgi:hypothetical protein
MPQDRAASIRSSNWSTGIVGDVLCHPTTDGKCLLFQMIEPVDLKPFLRSAPTVMLLDWNQREPPAGAEIAALRPALDHIKLAVHFALVHDEGNAAPEQAFERIGRTEVVGVKGVRTTASLDMAISRAQRSLRAFKLRRILLELLQNSDSPMTIAAIWEAVGERGGEVNSADPLAEITTVLAPRAQPRSRFNTELLGLLSCSGDLRLGPRDHYNVEKFPVKPASAGNFLRFAGNLLVTSQGRTLMTQPFTRQIPCAKEQGILWTFSETREP